MLALATGWTPDVLRKLPTGFRSRCHWVLYVRSIAGNEGLPDDSVPQRGSPDEIREAIRRRQAIAEIRANLFPEDDDG